MLDTIEVWDNITLDNIIMFEYEDKQLKTVKFSYDDRSMEFTYNVDNKVTACNCYGDGKLEVTYTFTHDGSKISKIVYTRYDNDKKSMKSGKAHSLLSYIMPGTKLGENVDRRLLTKAAKGKGNYTVTINFEWDGDNVSKARIEEASEDGEYYRETYEYTYDTMSNPYYCSLYHIIDEEVIGLCENNVTKVTWEGGDEEVTYKYKYTYTNDGNFPVQQTQIFNKEYYNTITYYEYQ